MLKYHIYKIQFKNGDLKTLLFKEKIPKIIYGNTKMLAYDLNNQISKHFFKNGEYIGDFGIMAYIDLSKSISIKYEGFYETNWVSHGDDVVEDKLIKYPNDFMKFY